MFLHSRFPCFHRACLKTIKTCGTKHAFTKIKRDAKMSFSDKISWVGGMMGLFTGFSVISGIEILYWLWFKVVFHRKNEVSPIEKSEEESDIGKLKEQMTLLQNEIT